MNPADEQLYRLAFLTESVGGSEQKGFSYRGHSLLVVFRCNASGRASSEPFVFVQTAKSWHCLFHAADLLSEMDATVEGNELVLWQLDWKGGNFHRNKFWTYDLRQLDAA